MEKKERKSINIWSFFVVVSVLVLGCLLGKIITTMFYQRVCVVGESMENTYYDGDSLLMKVGAIPDIEDIVVACPDGTEIIKRVVGVPGDTIQIKEGILFRNDLPVMEEYLPSKANGFEGGMAQEKIKLKEGEYFLLGDNRNNSRDSREIGVVNIKNIDGVIVANLW